MQPRGKYGRAVAALVACLILLLNAAACPSVVSAALSSPEGNRSLSSQQALQLGEAIYRRGILPSGAPVQAFVQGDIPVSGSMFSCESCHMRSGMGSVEGRIITPPAAGSKLFQPLTRLYKNRALASPILLRPAYSDSTLSDVIRGGIDPAGRTLNSVMPRYLLQDEDMALLIAYLKTLSAEFSPGVSDTTIRLATVIAEEVSPEERNAMLLPLENYIQQKNNQAMNYENSPRQASMAASMLSSMEVAYKRLSLSKWTVKGPPDTWRSQLEDYNRKDPVFALVGGITTGEWQPVHDFSEANRIPTIFPATDFPVISETDWYTLYLSRGYYQEGESTARYLHNLGDSAYRGTVLQLARESREGRTLAAAFQNTWQALGHQAPETRLLKPGEVLSKDLLEKLLEEGRPGALILWDGPEEVRTTLSSLAALSRRPERVFVSSSYLGKSLWALPEESRGFVYIAHPFRLPQDKPGAPMGDLAFQADSSKISRQVYSLLQVLNLALMDLKGNYYRDNLLDVISMTMDQETPLYERLSFGPGQRYASKGCYIVQLSGGRNPELIRKSDWVVH